MSKSSTLQLMKAFHIFILFCSSVVYAQDIPTDPSTITDKQLENAVNEAQTRGYTPSQIEAIARARGMSDVEISALRQRIQNLQSTSPEGGTIDEAFLRDEFGELDFENPELTARTLLNEDISGRVFGSEIFLNPKLSFAPSMNIPTPKDYQLGPGDELIIDIWGASEHTYQLLIGSEGTVKIPNIGPVYVNGLSIDEASKKLLSRLSKIFSALNESTPGGINTYGQVNLGRIRSIQVNVIGEVKTPGTYTVSSLSTVLHALYQSGGPNEKGSFRDIQVYRSGKIIASFDIYDYLTNGNIASNIVLRDQDIVRIPVFKKRVKLQGEIKQPAVFDLSGTESLQNVLDYAGGFTDEAYTRLVSVHRKTDYAKKIITLKSESFNQFQLQSGDEVIVSKILDAYENRVTISGAVKRPGAYELTESLSLKELIEKAEGLTSDVFLERGLLHRYNEDLTKVAINFSVKEVLNGTMDIPLMIEDKIEIKSIFDLSETKTVIIQGEVSSPGTFMFEDSLTVEDIIFMSGGFKESAAKSSVEVARRTNEDNNTEFNVTSILYQFPIDQTLSISRDGAAFVLEPFDIVTIRKSPYYNMANSIDIEGEVQFPGKFVMQSKQDRISDIIKRAGGFTDFAFLEGATLIRRSEYFDVENNVDAAARIRRNELDALFARDTLSKYATQLKKEESIGIDLVQIMKNPGGKVDMVLKEGDIISVPRELQTIRIRGEVLYPSVLRYDKTKSLRKFIAASGGFSSNALRKSVYVIYPNGLAGKTSSFLGFKKYPNVLPGSEVIVPEKPDKERLGAQEIVGFSSAILSMALIIDRLTR